MYKAKIPEAWARMMWCEQSFGPEGKEHKEQRTWSDRRWWRDKGYLFFRNEKDYMLYLLRWS